MRSACHVDGTVWMEFVYDVYYVDLVVFYSHVERRLCGWCPVWIEEYVCGSSRVSGWNSGIVLTMEQYVDKNGKVELFGIIYYVDRVVRVDGVKCME